MNKLLFATMLAIASCTVAGAAAQDLVPRCADPCVPKRLQSTPATPPASGEALQRQAVAKLRQRFGEADLDANGALTREEARKAGLGWIVNHFDDIDAARSGKVTFDDARNYMVRQRRQDR